MGAEQATVFVSDNDPEAKASVIELLRSFGWSDVVDLGDITTLGRRTGHPHAIEI